MPPKNQSNSFEKDIFRMENKQYSQKKEERKVLCQHCGRDGINGLRCLGVCVADNDY